MEKEERVKFRQTISINFRSFFTMQLGSQFHKKRLKDFACRKINVNQIALNISEHMKLSVTILMCTWVVFFFFFFILQGLCQNSGTCVDLVADYRCNCEAGWTGRHCQTNIDDCAARPCQNGGTCHDLVNGYQCR